MPGHLIERQIGQPQPVDCRIEDQFNRIEDQRTIDMDPDLTPLVDKPPRVQHACCRQTQIDGAMIDKLFGIFRERVPLKISRGANDRHRYIRAHPHGNHVLRDLLSQTNTRIETVDDDIDQPVIDDDLDIDVGISAQQFGDGGADDGFAACSTEVMRIVPAGLSRNSLSSEMR